MVECNLKGLDTTHLMTNTRQKKSHKTWRDFMWVSNHSLVTNSGRASVTVGVCISVRKKSPSVGRENHKKFVRCTDRTDKT